MTQILYVFQEIETQENKLKHLINVTAFSLNFFGDSCRFTAVVCNTMSRGQHTMTT